MKLLIVESPAKCKKINSLLGNDYIVLATGGHINRLNGLKSIDMNNNYKPTFSLMYDKMRYINNIISKSKLVDEVIIGTDLDREGEAIGYHIANHLKLNIKNTKRIVYNEISKSALKEAINNPIKLNIDIINSQKSRQIIDLMVGYHLSPLLWKNIQDYLSAGRCQSPALRLIYDNYNDINNNNIKDYYHISGKFINPLYNLEGSIDNKFKENEINNILEKIKKNKDHISISKIDTTEKKINPPYPFITSSIQQELSSMFHLSSKSSMNILQKLYESGKITYIRTDSYSISKGCSFQIKNYIENNYGNEYYKYRTYGNKSKNSQEAHECIRPVNINKTDLETDDISNKVYKLIWKRTIESQMSSYEYTEYKYTISIQNLKYPFISKLNQTKFLGFKINGKREDNIELINKIKLNDKLNYDEIICEQKFENIFKYTEGTLIKKLEKLGIGRPSTYASIISNLFDKNYIEKSNISSKNINKFYYKLKSDIINNYIVEYKTPIEKNVITITTLGIKVIKFLIEHFNELISYDYTNKLENDLDEIANGNLDYVSLIDKTYNSYYPIVKKLNKNNNKKEINKRLLGNHKSKKVYIYMSRYGPTVELSNSKTKKYVNLDKKTNINNIKLKDIKDLLDLPKKIGIHKDKEILLKKGKYGYYLTYNKNNYSLKKIKYPLKISKEKAIEIINT